MEMIRRGDPVFLNLPLDDFEVVIPIATVAALLREFDARGGR